jgi:hypothetical protein
MTRVGRSYEVAIDYDRRILHPGCTGGFSVGLHDRSGVTNAKKEAAISGHRSNNSLHMS